MRDAFKNPVVVFFAGLLLIWLVFYLLKSIVSLFWLVVLAFIFLFLFNERFRILVQAFFRKLLR